MKRSGLTLADLLTYAALALALVIFLAPVLWMLITAVKPPSEWLTTPPILVPSDSIGPISLTRSSLGEERRDWKTV